MTRAEIMLDADEIARMLGVPKGTVYRWASEDEWRRTKGRPTCYAAADAQQSYDQRRRDQMAAAARADECQHGVALMTWCHQCDEMLAARPRPEGSTGVAESVTARS